MKLPQNQLDLVSALVKTKKPVIVILAGGSAVELPFMNDVEAIVHSYLGGQGGGSALFDVLNGDYNPSGKLSESYPFNYEDVPSSTYYPGLEKTSEHRESIFKGYRYFDTVKKDLAYPFGFGLSYTSFQYSKLDIRDKTLSFEIKNTGNSKGEEVAQVYLRKLNSDILRAYQELVGFEKVQLEPGESKEIIITLKDHDFEFFNPIINDWDIERGSYEVAVGSSSRSIHLSEVIQVGGSSYESVTTGMRQYLDVDLGNLSHEDFQSLVEYKLPSPLWDKTKDLDINSMIKQSQYKGGFGKLINFIIIGLHHFLMKIGKVHAANNIIFAQNLPYRGLARMSGGMMDMAMLDGVILMSNGHFFKGSKVYMKSYFSKKKEERRKRKL